MDVTVGLGSSDPKKEKRRIEKVWRKWQTHTERLNKQRGYRRVDPSRLVQLLAPRERDREQMCPLSSILPKMKAWNSIANQEY